MYGITPTIPEQIDIRQYHALFTQSGTSHPVVTVLHNTLGENPTWARVNLGVYTLTSSGIWTDGKTLIVPFGDEQNVKWQITALTASNPQEAFNIRRDSTTDITLRCYSSPTSVALKEFSDVPNAAVMIMIYLYK